MAEGASAHGSANGACADVQQENEDHSLAEALASLAGVQSNALLEYGGRLIAVREFCQAVAALLPSDSRAQAKQLFRDRIERVLELLDERALPSESQGAFLGEVNYFLRALEPCARP
jgi:hypothetical protein